MTATVDAELTARLAAVQVSSLCDADKALPVLDPAIAAVVVPQCTVVGPAWPVRAHDDHLPLLVAVGRAPAGSVLVVATDGGSRAVSGELFATEARRRGLAAIVVDGYCRDRRGLGRIGLPVYARGSTPMAGTTRDPGSADPAGPLRCGGVDVAPGDLVVADPDGVVVAPAERLAAALPGAEAVEKAEAAVLAGMAAGTPLAALTNLDEHLAALAAGRDSALEFRA